MEAPQAPIDIKITLGSEQNCQNLVNINFDITDKADEVKNYLAQKKITQDFGNDAVLMFDFNVQPGRQQEAINYFDQNIQGEGKSPLQILFKKRPSEHSELCKFTIEKHQGFVRLVYRFFLPPENEEMAHINQMLQIFKNNGLAFQAHANFDIKGQISHNKKNRVNVKVDYAKFQFTSNAFNSQNLLNSFSAIEQFHQDMQQILNNPFTQLLKKSKMAKVNIKLDSFRRINKYYTQVAQQAKQPQSKQFKYNNKGIFRQRADASFVYKSYLVKLNGKFESEDVFIRLLKVYAKFGQKLLNETFYEDD